MVQFTTATALRRYVPLTPTEVSDRAAEIKRAAYAAYIARR